jgi:site-specific DNA-methyltransferase (adenine-specific)
MKASRNKTIDVDVVTGADYLNRCITVTASTTVQAVQDKTICGDVLQVAAFLPKGFVDLLIADPPYNINKDFHGNKFRRMSTDEYAQYTSTWVDAVEPLLADHASVYVCCDWTSSAVVERVLREHFYVQNRITWQREKGRGALSNWKNGMEDVWFATKAKMYTFNVDAVKMRRRVIAPYKTDGKPRDWEETKNGNFRNTYPSNLWDDISVPYWSMPENTAHPTQKPEKLMAKLILASSNAGDVVFDPFLGSGTTSVVAKKLGRHYVGVEVNPQYCVWAEKRLEMADDNKSIQGYADGVFWERNTGNMQKANNKHSDKKDTQS